MESHDPRRTTRNKNEGGSGMTENEKELIRIIRSSNDPAAAMEIAIEIICQFLQERKTKVAPLGKPNK